MSAQPEALRLADELGRLANLEANDLADCMEEAATELRRLVAENEEKDALLRQAVEALEEITRILNAVLGVSGGFPPGADGPAVEAKEAITAIRQHLGQKRETG